MDRTCIERNARDGDWLRRLAADPADDAPRRPLDDGWTVAAALARLAFWDRSVEERWDRYARHGAIDELLDGIVDIANPAGRPD